MESIKPTEFSELKELFHKYSPFFIEIKKRILLSLYVFGASAVIGFVFYESIIKFIVNILALRGINIVFTSPFQFINLAFSCGLATGLIAIFPLILYQTLSFLKPALKVKEYKMIVRFLPFSILLFLLGFLFGFYIMKWQIEIFLNRSVSLGIGNILDISKLISTVMFTSVLMGIGFQFPIILLILLRIGILKNIHLTKKRKWIYFGSLIFAILLPPESILADILLALPLIILFECTLLLNHLLARSRG